MEIGWGWTELLEGEEELGPVAKTAGSDNGRRWSESVEGAAGICVGVIWDSPSCDCWNKDGWGEIPSVSEMADVGVACVGDAGTSDLTLLPCASNCSAWLKNCAATLDSELRSRILEAVVLQKSTAILLPLCFTYNATN